MTENPENRYTPRFKETLAPLLRSDISYNPAMLLSTVKKTRKKCSVAFNSPLLAKSSWTIVGTELMNALDKLGIPAYMIPWSTSGEICQGRFKKSVLPRNTVKLGLEDIRQYIKLLHLKAIIRLSHPDSFNAVYPLREYFPDLKIIGYSVAESDSINGIWTEGCNAMDQVWGTSQFTCDVYRKSGVKVPMYHVPHGVRVNLFKPENADEKLRKRLKLDDKFVILYVGRVDKRKNLAALIRAYAMIERSDTHLVIHGDKRPQDIGLIKRLGIRNVTYTEDISMGVWSIPHSRMPKIYGLALGRRRGCHVLPSHSEGFGMTLVEAGAMGLPCVAVNWSAPPEIILDKKTGLLIPIRGFEEVGSFINSGGRWACFIEEELAGLIESLYANSDACEEMGERAMKHVRENFTWKKAAECARQPLINLISSC